MRKTLYELAVLRAGIAVSPDMQRKGIRMASRAKAPLPQKKGAVKVKDPLNPTQKELESMSDAQLDQYAEKLENDGVKRY